MTQKRKNHLLKITESEIEKAEIVLATRNEIVDKLQRDAEKIANMKVDILSPLVDRVKAEHGLDAAERFRHSIESKLDNCLNVILQTKDEISTEVLKLTGDLSSAPDIGSLGTDESGDVDSFDIGDDAGLESLPTPEPDATTEPAPIERGFKESKDTRKYVAIVEGVDGSRGKKFAKTKKELTEWLNKNSHLIAKVVNVGLNR